MAGVLTGMLAVCLLACTKTAAPVIPKTEPLPDVVSFSQHIMPLFNAYCNTPGCHSGASPTGNLDLSPAMAYARLFAKHEVDTLNTDASVLYIEMNSASNPMPPSGRLNDHDVQLVHKWIVQKAKNN